MFSEKIYAGKFPVWAFKWFMFSIIIFTYPAVGVTCFYMGLLGTLGIILLFKFIPFYMFMWT